jgi:hypothetical protein
MHACLLVRTRLLARSANVREPVSRTRACVFGTPSHTHICLSSYLCISAHDHMTCVVACARCLGIGNLFSPSPASHDSSPTPNSTSPTITRRPPPPAELSSLHARSSVRTSGLTRAACLRSSAASPTHIFSLYARCTAMPLLPSSCARALSCRPRHEHTNTVGVICAMCACCLLSPS